MDQTENATSFCESTFGGLGSQKAFPSFPNPTVFNRSSTSTVHASLPQTRAVRNEIEHKQSERAHKRIASGCPAECRSPRGEQIVPQFLEFSMRLCRFAGQDGGARVGFVDEAGSLFDLSGEGAQLSALLELDDLPARLAALRQKPLPCYALDQVRLLAPVERQEVWAAGVTYLRSKRARMEESDFSANAYDRVYEAARPELFFKSLAEKVAGTGDDVGIRQDARWNVPEPELALVINSRGRIAGYTIGNDMSSRDIEGENLLYLPQAKVYSRSCALGPFVRAGVTEAEARTWTVTLQVQRGGATVFEGQTALANIKRSFEELVGYLFRSQEFPHGVVLLTGTGVVPGNEFSLQPNDAIRIQISTLGTLENTVKTV
jgi:2-dehydro-3-deoxy-D-arabinonate dehydratase